MMNRHGSRAWHPQKCGFIVAARILTGVFDGDRGGLELRRISKGRGEEAASDEKVRRRTRCRRTLAREVDLEDAVLELRGWNPIRNTGELNVLELP